MAGGRTLDRSMRAVHLTWLAENLALHSFEAAVVGPPGAEVLRLVTRGSGSIRYVVCVPAPQVGTWAWLWSNGWALVTDPNAVAMIAKAMRS
ncbi:hypothetical protein GCM10022416_51470 [Actinomadura keratinilytica]|uniref:Uncharacterized protein n=2 Tax=Actinomadura keratinilytica TaxID=547461 RepID=A0ABP7ZC40_9ACTN